MPTTTATKKITAKIPYQELTDTKQTALDREYTAVQQYTKGDESVELYSATRQQQKRKLDRSKVDAQHDYPWFLRNDCFNIEEHDTEEYTWWLNIPVDTVYGGINVPIQPHESLRGATFNDSKIIKKNNEYYAHLTIEQEVDVQTKYDEVIGVDLGVRHAAVTVSLTDRSTTFYGEDIRAARRHYHETRAALQENGAYRALQRLHDKEERVVDDALHKIARQIVQNAVDRNALIVIGDLSGVQNQDKGAEMNRRLHSMPQYKLRQYIAYKALFEGLVVREVNEYNTSQACWRCGEVEDTARVGQGQFLCGVCGLDDNADKNGATNIALKGLGKDVNTGLSGECPLSGLGGSCELSLELGGDDGAAVTTTDVVVRLRADPEAHRFSGE